MKTLLTNENVNLLLVLLTLIAGIYARRTSNAKAALTGVETTNAALDALQRIVATSVLAYEQTHGKALKNPGKPGVWDDAAKRAARTSVVTAVKDAGAPLIEALRGAGLPAPVIEGYITQMVEASVLEMDASTRNALAGASSAQATPNTEPAEDDIGERPTRAPGEVV